MGIPHLFSFVSRQTNSFFNIDIVQEIDNWYRQNNGKPTIVIDFPAFTHAVCDDPVDSFFGCRSITCFNQTETFFNVFQQKGVNLVFFEDGPMQPDLSEKVIKRQNERFDDIFKALDDLYECNLVDKLISKHNVRHHACLIGGVRSIARRFGEFHKVYHNDFNKEAAAYATKVNAMAVISDNTNYLIFKGNWQYWSSKHINFTTLTTKNYSKIDFQRHLQLTENEMPLFATLAGNDIISIQLLDRFHRYLGNPRYKFENISSYIIKHFRNLDSYEPEFVAKEIFRNTNKSSEYTELVRTSLNFFNIDKLNVIEYNDNDFLKRMKSLHNDCYPTLLDMARSSTISYFDVRTPQFEKFPSLMLDLIRRQLGVILQHKSDKTLIRHIYCYQNGRYVYEKLHPDYPPISVPKLDDLYNVDKNDELKMVKLRLLAWVLSDRLDINAIITIDRKYFCVCLTLYYMVENVFITVREADIFLHMVDTVYEHFSTIIDLPRLERVDPRAFQILFLYDKVYLQVMHSISNCGLFELTEHNHMDGLYFHHAYNKLHDLANNEQMNVHLERLRLYDGLKLRDE